MSASWPIWACDEDGEVYWIRADIAQRNDLSLIPELRKMLIGTPSDAAGEWWTCLVFSYAVPCWLDLAPDRPEQEWLIHELHADDRLDEAVVYWCCEALLATEIASDDLVLGVAA